MRWLFVTPNFKEKGSRWYECRRTTKKKKEEPSLSQTTFYGCFGLIKSSSEGKERQEDT